ncbi:hypothetical protein BJ912DRAFT_2688 [Pholiota molesta]|nr:hypothetical protein BJ912DRAFT_2688 [Pholiota molesta]
MRFQQKFVLLGVQYLASSILAAAQITNCVTGTILCCGIVEPLTPENSLPFISVLPSPIPQGELGLECTQISALDVLLGQCTTTVVCCTTFIPTLEVAAGCGPFDSL